MPRCTRLPSRTIVCMHSPPLPGCHLRACSWLLMPSTISQESPPSVLRNRDAGSTPHHRSFLLSPGSSDQMFASARPSSFGNAGADLVSLNLLPRSVDTRTFMPKKGLQLDAYMRGLLRVSIRVEYTGMPGPNGPRSSNFCRFFDPSATKR